jgi:hypothetical protein
MLRPDRKVLEALARLSQNSDFDQVLMWVKESEQQLYKDFVMSVDPEQLLRIQGECRVIADFLAHIGKARESLSKTVGGSSAY